MSNIEWTSETWNPVTGCTQISPGCKNCYAKTMHKRLQAMGQEKYSHDFNTVRIHDNFRTFDKIWHMKKSKMIFVNSMSDLFHKDIPMKFIYRVFHNMFGANQHIYQVLTKRPARLLEFEQTEFETYASPVSGADLMSKHIWLGTSVENQHVADQRIPLLIKSKAKVKFLSCEPLLGPLDLREYINDIDWVIVGGESGPHQKIREFKIEWAIDIMKQCNDASVPFFFKQTGSLLRCDNKSHECYNKSKGCHYLDNVKYNEFPMSEEESS